MASPEASAGAADEICSSSSSSSSDLAIDEQDQDHPAVRRYVYPQETEELMRIARTISRRESVTTENRNARLRRLETVTGIPEDSPVFDPNQPEFDLYKWVRRSLHLMDEKGIKLRRAGFAFKNLNVSGSGTSLNLQQTVGSSLMAPLRPREFFKSGNAPERKILCNFDGVLKSGELLIVLGRPGSGCSTLLKTLSGELYGLKVDENSVIHYNGIPQEMMLKNFRGEVVYNQEVDKHFPHLTVGQTLEFAAACRAPKNRLWDITRKEYAILMRDVMLAIFGLSHTINTKVGNDFVRGVSGGERKRVSIAEMALSGSPIACWDNSTRGLDAATALEFVRALRTSADLVGTCHAVAIYQASQDIYDQFDKTVVLYEGREIYYGPSWKAKKYFEDMGWHCPQRQTTGDFLTSVTNPSERKTREGYEAKVPRTVDEFEKYWKSSSDYAELLKEIDRHESEYPIGGPIINEFRESRRQQQADHVRPDSPFTISTPMQIRLCISRAYQRIWNDKVATLTTVNSQIVLALIIGSIFYGTPDDSRSFFAKGGVLFFAVLLNALMSLSEIGGLYSQRPIIEKQASLYHPFAEALAGVVSDIPVKFGIAVFFNIILYFLAGLRREPSQFFIFFLFAFISILTMSAVFRAIAASTKTISQALAIAGVMVLAIVIYTGFTLPRPYMHPWFKWLSWINPIAYSFEALLINELHGRDFPCANLIPAYPNLSGDTFVCSVAGAVPGERFVSGDAFAEAAYGYSYSHIWRNLGILFAFMFFFLFIYLLATELNASTASTAEVLVFRRGHVPKRIQNAGKDASGSNGDSSNSPAVLVEFGKAQDKEIKVIPPQHDIFTWRNVVYDISIKGEPRRLLDHVSGWVKPGTLTALMGVSGAGKTTLLDVLAQRTTMGVITGDMLVNGRPLDSSFQRKTGYVQQQDLHLETSTVREALRFSAMLRQPKAVSKKEKYEYVEDVIEMLNMEDFAEAVVGVPGEGLNVEQRKLLTIVCRPRRPSGVQSQVLTDIVQGVELAAKPALLLFLDEPTSGLDSQSSWAIVAFLRKLANSGQAVLTTIHQPSSILFQEFDRLLFLAKGGKTVYFGDIGHNSKTLLNYFERHGGRKCGPHENPAEYMLGIVGAGATGKSAQNWPELWMASEENQNAQAELDRLHRELGGEGTSVHTEAEGGEFAMPFTYQLLYVTRRVFEQYWRTPSYILGKFILGIASALFIGFSFFQPSNSMQGLQNVIFSVFMLTTIFSSLVQQIMPRFVTQRDLYEVRERPSKAYSWAAFLIANIVVEIPYQLCLGVVVFASYNYAIFGIQVSERQGLILLLCIQFFIFASTFAQMVISALPDAQTAGNIATLLFSMTMIFNG
ncbi:GTPase-activating protein [Glutinoglossum americanum]|uniref:GTPase-activating protein n=1 Tax=Glutinoglossum americanum TaxID=1670608 RepID=A0A9P8KZK1_9PEZI|nr:GTPase-activating protein [Glutinoglossum americanum]